MSGYIFFSFQAVMIGISLGTLSLFTVVGNTMVLHAVKTERRLQTVRVTGISKWGWGRKFVVATGWFIKNSADNSK